MIKPHEDAPLHPARNRFHPHPQAKFDEAQASIRASRDDIKAGGQRTELMLDRMSALERALSAIANIIAIVALAPAPLGMLYCAMASLQGRGPGAAFALSALGLILVAAAVAIVWVARSLCQFGGPRLAGPAAAATATAATAAAATAAATGGRE